MAALWQSPPSVPCAMCGRGREAYTALDAQYAPRPHAQQSQVLKLKTIMRINVGRTFNDVRPAGGSRANAHVEAWERQYAPVCASPRLVWARNRARDKGDTARLGFQQRLTRPLHPRAPAPCCARPRSPKPNVCGILLSKFGPTPLFPRPVQAPRRPSGRPSGHATAHHVWRRGMPCWCP